MSDTTKVNIEKRYCPNCYQQFDSTVVNCPKDGSVLRGADNDPIVGTVFADRYLVQSVLGLGGMSIVYKAQHRLMNRTVAIKMLHNKLKDDNLALERFRLEAQAAASLNHQNIVTVYDFGVSPEGEPFFVMDCLEGESLDQLIERKGRLPHDRALPIFKQICSGLEAAHRKGIVHRDLKPANVVLIKEDSVEIVKIVDFGIAKILPRGDAKQQQLTQTGEVFGSPVYMSPEQCLGKDLDTRSDIYALGCLMYDTLTGRPPFTGTSILETMNMQVNDAPRSLADLHGDIPAPYEGVIFRCMEKDPNDRFATAGEVQDHLSAISLSLTGGNATTVRVQYPTGSRPALKERSQAILTIVSCVVAILGISGFAFVALWPGPVDDRGTPLGKLLWQLSLSQGEDAIKAGNYELAAEKLNAADEAARAFGDLGNRLEATLKRKAELYDKWEGHAEQLEQTNNEIAAMQVERLKHELDMRLQLLKELEKKETSPVRQSSATLRAEAQIPSIVATAGKLDGRSMYEEEEELLTRALEVEKRLLGPDAHVLNDMETDLANCLVSQRKYPRVRALLSHVSEVEKKVQGEGSADYTLALNRLGQFDLDSSDYKAAVPELTKAYELALKLGASDKRITLLCMRSYADMLRQVNRLEEMEKVNQAIKELEGKH